MTNQLKPKTMPKWLTLGNEELGRMRRAAAALPLAEALKTHISAKATYELGPGHGRGSQHVARADSELTTFIQVVETIKNGGTLVSAPDSADPLEKMIEGIMASSQDVRFELPAGTDTLPRIRRLNASIAECMKAHQGEHRDTTVIATAIMSGIFQTYGLDVGTSTIQTSMEDCWASVERVWQEKVAVGAIYAIADILKAEDTTNLQALAITGKERAARFVKLSHTIAKTRDARRQAARRRERLELACPAAIAAIREQSIIIPMELRLFEAIPEIGAVESVRADGMVEQSTTNGMVEHSATDEPAGPSPEKCAVRSEREDIAILERQYPRLYGKMLAPTPAEMELKKLKRAASQLRREGVPCEAIRSILNTGVITKEGIQRAYEQSRTERDGIPATSALPAKKPSKWPIYQNGAMIQNGVPAAMPPIRDMDDLIASVRLNEEARNHIRDAGLKPADVLFCMFKGFSLISKKCAVGGGHYRGAVIRRSIRNCMKRRYTGLTNGAPSVDRLLDYLKSVDLVIELGSSKCTRTKDEAMSLNTNPSHSVGAEIMSRITEVQIGQMKGSSKSKSQG